MAPLDLPFHGYWVPRSECWYDPQYFFTQSVPSYASISIPRGDDGVATMTFSKSSPEWILSVGEEREMSLPAIEDLRTTVMLRYMAQAEDHDDFWVVRVPTKNLRERLHRKQA